MPKLGMEPIRRAALIDAAIAEIGAAGSLNVPVSRIARRAGMSSALAHHYFGSKDQMLLAAMRHIQAQFGARVRHALARAHSPRDRLDAIITASFDAEEFSPGVVSAWLAFYMRAQTSAAARRLLHVYTRRLHSNLVHALRQMTDPASAQRIARMIGALIDGLYIRQALGDAPPGRDEAVSMVWEHVDLTLAAAADVAGSGG